MNNLFIFLKLLFFSTLAFNPSTGKYNNCVIIRIENSSITLWDIEKFSVLEMINDNLSTKPTLVEQYIIKNKKRIIENFIIYNETKRIGYQNTSINDFENVYTKKIEKQIKNKKYRETLKNYSLDNTAVASYYHMKNQIKSYLYNFIYKFIEVNDSEITRFLEKNRNTIKINKRDIKRIILIKKQKKRYNDYIKKLMGTIPIEIIHSNLKCNYGGKNE